MSNNDQFDDLDDFDDFDEISDDMDAVPEGAAAEEDWDQFSDEASSDSEMQDESSKKTSGKKKSGLLNLLLIGGIVLAGGAFMFLQTAGKTTSAPAPVPQEEPLIEDQIAEMPTNPPSAPPMPAPILQPEAELEITQQETAAPVNSPLPGSDTLPPLEDQAAMRMPKAEDILLKSAPENASGSPISQPSSEPQAVIAAPSVPLVPAAPVAPAVSGPEIDLMMEKLDALSARMESLETQLKTYREETPQANDDSVTGEQIKALQQSLARLEARMDQGLARAQREPEREIMAPPPMAKPVPQILGRNSGNADVRESPQAVKPKTAPAAAISVNWVLKGAQPGRAMVAKKGETDLQPVEVGDTLPGIGRITAIEYRSGKWSVLGTDGTITQ